MTDSPEAQASPFEFNRDRRMAKPKTKDRAARRFDPMTAMAVLCFLAAVGFAAVPAFHAGPATRAGVMLLIGLFGVACLGLFALRNSAEPVVAGEPGADQMVDALTEPAAIAAADGRIHAANAAWRSLLGAAARLPKGGASAASLFSALTAARRGETAQASIRNNGS